MSRALGAAPPETKQRAPKRDDSARTGAASFTSGEGNDRATQDDRCRDLSTGLLTEPDEVQPYARAIAVTTGESTDPLDERWHVETIAPREAEREMEELVERVALRGGYEEPIERSLDPSAVEARRDLIEGNDELRYERHRRRRRRSDGRSGQGAHPRFVERRFLEPRSLAQRVSQRLDAIGLEPRIPAHLPEDKLQRQRMAIRERGVFLLEGVVRRLR